ncbi:MAG: selenide, water dikinase SelD [Desulfobacteraceae bacterium]|nr:MAG: selenide, water dikinase SelD [Desulfobacteraceae bacterium]
MDPVGLGELIAKLPKNDDPNLLVGFDTSDDAGVYRLSDELAVITTADFITPPVDDPYIFGQIAAANALSDVYAMGGRPIACINLVAFPTKKLDAEILHGIVAGALSKITEAGAVLAGGHSIEDEEPKFGLAVTGIVHPEKYWTNSGAKPGDVLILTKPIGSGVLFNANLANRVSPAALKECISLVTALNRKAAEVLTGFEVHAVTDITGFGLAGHAFEMARGSRAVLTIDMDRIPVMREALEMYRKGVNTGANLPNRSLVSQSTRFERNLPNWRQEILFDPQTSGGLLAAVSGKQHEDVLAALHEAGIAEARCIGEVKSLENEFLIIFA